MKEHLSKDKPSPWLIAYRLLCKHAPGLPEMYHEYAGLSQMVRSFQAATLVAPIPGPVHQKISEQQKSQVFYAAYLEERSGGCFLDYARTHVIGKDGKVKQLSLIHI